MNDGLLHGAGTRPVGRPQPWPPRCPLPCPPFDDSTVLDDPDVDLSP